MTDRDTRLARFRKGLATDSLKAALITHLPNIYYLSGFRGSDGALLITEKESILLVDGRYGTQARTQSPESRVSVYSDKVTGISTILSELGLAEVGFESRAITVELMELIRAQSSGVTWKRLRDWLIQLRAVKSREEIELLQNANRIADGAAADLMIVVRQGMTEADVANELEYLMKKGGAERASFPILVGGGERGALPHCSPTDRPLKPGECFILDFGCTLEGYQTDQTLTLSIGKPTAKMKEIYEIVREAHDKALEAVHPGAVAKDLDGIARKMITDRGYGEYFSHSLGHGVGIEVHEYPMLNSKSAAILEEGMIVTIEPGIYIPGVGGVRIEDAVIVRRNGPELLTTVDKGLRCL